MFWWVVILSLFMDIAGQQEPKDISDIDYLNGK